MDTPWRFFYDCECGFCERQRLRAYRWATRLGKELEAECLQSQEAVAKGYPDDAFVLEADGRVYFGGDAALHLLHIAPVPLRWLAWTERLSLAHRFMGWAYPIVARLRHRIGGAKSCRIP